MVKSKINERIKEIRLSLKLTQAIFAQKLGKSVATISTWERVGRHIPDASIMLICRVFNVSRDWLENGQGVMFEKSGENQTEETIPWILSKYRTLPPELREIVRRLAEAILVDSSN